MRVQCRIAVMTAAICCLLTGCYPAALDSEQQSRLEDAEYSDVVRGTSAEYTYSVENSGIFYLAKNHGALAYYDFDTEDNYILCSSPNCEHNDSSCPVYVGDHYRNYSFAYYGGRLYLLKRDGYDSAKIELVSMDAGGQNQKTVATLDAGEYTLGSWAVNSIDPVYFTGNKALLTVDYTQPAAEENSGNVQGMQLLIIDLTDGSITDLTGILRYNIDAVRVLFELVTEQFAVYEIVKYETPYLFEWEYEEKYGEEAFQQNYQEYYADYMNHTEASVIYRAVNLQTGEISEVWSGQMYPSYWESGSLPTMLGPNFTFSYEGCLYYTPAENLHGPESTYEAENVNLEIHKVDPETGEDTVLEPFAEPMEDYWYIEQSSNGGYRYSEDEILVCNDFHQEETFCLYLYSLAANELTEITREIDRNLTIWGMTDDRVIQSRSYNKPSWITKEDFKKGEFNRTVKINLEW